MIASPVITPVYSTEDPNAPILLYEGPLILEQAGNQINCDGQIQFEWLPSPQISFSTTQLNNQTVHPLISIGFKSTNEPVTLGVPGAIRMVPLGITETNFGAGENGSYVTLNGHCDDAITFEEHDDLHHVLFQLVNFEVMSDQAIESESHSWLGRASAEFDNWILTIDTVENYKEIENSVKKQRGYAITHAARLERADGSTFKIEQVKEVLDALYWFFSFARGFWSPPILPVGFNIYGKQVWCEWQALRATAWRGASGWFNDCNYASSNLKDALCGFWKKWNDALWNDPANNNTPLRLAIHWFISANTDAGGVEGCIILAQTGLELMAWVRLVEQMKIYTASQFDDLKNFSAARKFEALLHYMGVDTNIPNSLKQLMALANSKTWNNGPEAIVGYRNSIVHPKRRAANKNIVFLESYELCELALWYLELSILHLWNYNGYCTSRIQERPRPAGQAQMVPWAIQQAAPK